VLGLAAFQSYCLALFLGLDMDTFHLLQISVELASSIYLALLLPIYAFVRTSHAHAQVTCRVFTLSMFCAIHYYFNTQGQVLAINYFLQPHWTGYVALGLACMTAVTSGSIRLGPGYFRDQGRLYNKAVAEKQAETEDFGQANVMGSGRSIIGHFMAFYMTDMVRHVASLDQVDLHQLPVLPAAMQQQPSIIESVAWRKQSGKWLSPTLSLLWEVWAPQWLGWAQSEALPS
jgi:hypothetical protein